MMRYFLFAILVCFAQTAGADDAEDHEFLYGYLSGTYLAIGRELGSDRTYSGKVVFESREDHLVVTRAIGDEMITGIGTIEHALGPDKAHVLRIRFTRNGEKYEITYLWRSDLDNYARLSGYVYQPGKRTTTPGLEALFIGHPAK